MHGIILNIGIVRLEKHLLQLFLEHLQYRGKDIILILDQPDVIGIHSSMGNYLFHSVLYSKYNGSLMDGRVGIPLSHGCVRLQIDNAKWIYDNIPRGTKVVIY